MEINNLDKIKELLVFKSGKNNSPEIYYFIQVIQRRKDNPEMEGSEYQRGCWFITSIKDLEKHWPRIKKTCDDFNARAYISLTPRSLEKLGKKCLLEYSNRVVTGDYSRVYDIPKKAALSDYTIQCRGLIDKPRWIIDIDNIDHFEGIKDILSEGITKILKVLQTPGGIHLVVEAFNPRKLQKFTKSFSNNNLYEDYELSGGLKFTLRIGCNTILYSNIKKL